MENKNKKIIYNFILLPIISILILSIIIFGYGIYRFHWQGSFVYRLTQIFPFPAIFVDWEGISYHTYLDELKTTEKYWESQKQNSNVLLNIPSALEIRERLVDKLIEEKIIKIFARKNGITVTPEDINTEWEKLQSKESDSNQIKEFLSKNYGWTEDKFKNRVLSTFILEQKVKANLIKSNNSDDEVLKKQANEVYQYTQETGANFADLAKKYSADKASAKNGGDLGYFSRGTFEPQVEQVIFSMKIGDISKPIKSSFGYQIIQLNDLLFNEDNVPTQAAISQILIKSFDFDDWLKKQKNTLAIYRLVL